VDAVIIIEPDLAQTLEHRQSNQEVSAIFHAFQPARNNSQLPQSDDLQTIITMMLMVFYPSF
jgi:hypothetical protein